MTRRAILPENYDFLSNRQSTYEEQENMTVVPNDDAPPVVVPVGPEPCLNCSGHLNEILRLRSRLSSVEQERDEARKDVTYWSEVAARAALASFRAARDSGDLSPAARSSSDQEGR